MKKQQGLSLVELMISITLGLVLMAGVVQMFISTKSSYAVQQGMSKIQETGRLAIEFVGRDLRMASAVGCVRMQSPSGSTANVVDPLNTNKGGLHKDFLIGLMGYDSPSALTATGVSLLQAVGTMVPSASSNILVIRGAMERGFPVSVKNTGNAITVFKGASTIANNCIDGLCQGGVAVVSDCDSGRIFTATTLTAAGNVLTITHNEAWDTAGADVNVYNARPEVFVYPMHTMIYFVAPGASGEPSLWQRIDRQTSLELVEGVERIGFTYQVAGSNNFIAAGAVSAAQWRDIVAVRMNMIVRGAEMNALENAQTYTFPGDAAATVPDDRRIRQLFSNTFSIRTRNNQL